MTAQVWRDEAVDGSQVATLLLERQEMLTLIGDQQITIAELQEAVLRTADKAMQDAYAVGKVRAALQLARSFVSIHETPWSLAILPDIDAALLETVDPPTEVR